MKREKKIMTVIAFCMLSFLSLAAREDILGRWISPKYKDGNQVILEVYEKEDGQFYGKMIGQTVPLYQEGEFAGQEKMDLKNPDASLRTRKLIGLELMERMSYQEEANDYSGGQIYIPGMGKTMYAKIQIHGKEMKMKASFDKLGVLGKTQLWTKYEN